MSHKIIKGFSIERTKQKENLKKERKIFYKCRGKSQQKFAFESRSLPWMEYVGLVIKTTINGKHKKYKGGNEKT
jgi:hypothetical protein